MKATRPTFALLSLRGHLESPEVRAWMKSHPNATPEEIIGDDWHGCDYGAFDSIADLNAAMLGILRRLGAHRVCGGAL